MSGMLSHPWNKGDCGLSERARAYEPIDALMCPDSAWSLDRTSHSCQFCGSLRVARPAADECRTEPMLQLEDERDLQLRRRGPGLEPSCRARIGECCRRVAGLNGCLALTHIAHRPQRNADRSHAGECDQHESSPDHDATGAVCRGPICGLPRREPRCGRGLSAGPAPDTAAARSRKATGSTGSCHTQSNEAETINASIAAAAPAARARASCSDRITSLTAAPRTSRKKRDEQSQADNSQLDIGLDVE